MNKLLLGLLLGALAATPALAEEKMKSNTHAGRAVEHGAASFSHASGSIAHSIAASGQVTSAASAIPLAISGGAGAVSGQLAHDSMKAATAPIGAPLPITDEAMTVVPPNEALRKKDGKPEEKL